MKEIKRETTTTLTIEVTVEELRELRDRLVAYNRLGASTLSVSGTAQANLDGWIDTLDKLVAE